MDRRNGGINRRGLLVAAGAAVAATAMAQPTQAVTATRQLPAGPEPPATRADLAERAIVQRHVRMLWGRPRRRLGTLVWPASVLEHSFARWCYWWQAQLLDCAVDAAHRARTPERIDRVVALARGIRTRNLTGWTNRYYDDMAWLALALERADRLLGIRFGDAVGELRAALIDGWHPIGAVPWRTGDDFYNTPAIGPTGIAMARLGELSRARALSEFLHTRLRDADSGLVLDGVHEPGGRVERTVHTYCQGVAIGLEVELARRTNEPVHHRRASDLIAATGERLTDAGVIAAAAGDDSGLFMGILARYLAEAALSLGDSTAARIVHASARAAWRHRAEVDGLPLFGVDWARPVTVPDPPGTFPADPSATLPANLSRDLSVQLSGWMLLEAEQRLTAAGR
ncbi:glycoside hydrolase family 76 protein [Nocardia blacklockiae]|uniref:glycoside hydrolase family 76 protein n=1 Tax=Nocardia blacklockiae TaxID=480036 RepID=UPI001896165E|nr:glycoside hydrolase family 76 protein [Nocardia blacklockiae]MBF6170337.1 fructose-bisphosphate aldolase [Nocardia blacklockiae]